jgi:hypothetical protein
MASLFAQNLTITHTFASEGYQSLEIGAFNDVSATQETASIVILEPVSGLGLPTNIVCQTNSSCVITAQLTSGTRFSIDWYVDNVHDANTSDLSFARIFSLPGIYNISATASNALTSESSWTLLSVQSAISGIAVVAPTFCVVDEPIFLSVGIQTGSDVTYTWSYALVDDTSGRASGRVDVTTNVPNQQRTFSSAGVYEVSVSAYNLVSNVSANSMQIQCQPRLSSLAVVSPQFVKVNTTVSFEYSAINASGVSFRWSVVLNQSTVKSEVGPSFTYLFPQPGTYLVTLNASNDVSWIEAYATVEALNSINVILTSWPNVIVADSGFTVTLSVVSAPLAYLNATIDGVPTQFVFLDVPTTGELNMDQLVVSAGAHVLHFTLFNSVESIELDLSIWAEVPVSGWLVHGIDVECRQSCIPPSSICYFRNINGIWHCL